MSRTIALALLVSAVVLGMYWRSAVQTPLAAVGPPAAITSGIVRLRYPEVQGRPITLPGGGQEKIHSLLDVRGRFNFGEFAWNTDSVPAGPIWVRVDLDRQLISVFRAGHEIGSSVIIYGASNKPTPHGRFTVQEKAQDHYSRSYDAPMPYMLRLTADGVAIHASYVRPGTVTHGCIGVPLTFARLLFSEMRVGDKVYIATAKPG